MKNTINWLLLQRFLPSRRKKLLSSTSDSLHWTLVQFAVMFSFKVIFKRTFSVRSSVTYGLHSIILALSCAMVTRPWRKAVSNSVFCEIRGAKHHPCCCAWSLMYRRYISIILPEPQRMKTFLSVITALYCIQIPEVRCTARSDLGGRKTNRTEPHKQTWKTRRTPNSIWNLRGGIWRKGPGCGIRYQI